MKAEELYFCIDEHFHNLTEFSPRKFPRETIYKIRQRQEILLRTPAGSGKTETVIACFLPISTSESAGEAERSSSTTSVS